MKCSMFYVRYVLWVLFGFAGFSDCRCICIVCNSLFYSIWCCYYLMYYDEIGYFVMLCFCCWFGLILWFDGYGQLLLFGCALFVLV